MVLTDGNHDIINLNAGESVVPLLTATGMITPTTVFTTSTGGNIATRAAYVDPTQPKDDDDDDDDDEDESKADPPTNFEDDEGYGGIMVAFLPVEAERYVVEGGLDADDLHVTLCYLGTEENVTDGAQQLIRDVTNEVATGLRSFEAKSCGVGVLGEDDAVVVLLESMTFNDVKSELNERLAEILPRDGYPHFVPHMTLGYGVSSDVIDDWRGRIGETITIGGMRAAFGESYYDFNLQEQPSEEADRMTDPVATDTAPTQKKFTTERPIEQERSVRPLDVGWSQRNVTDESQVDHRRLPDQVIARLRDQREDVGVIDRVGRALCEMRFRPEIRRNADGSVGVHGYATVYDYAYDVGEGPPYGWTETITAGACDKSVSEAADVRFLVNHDGIALARTRSKTMTLASDEHGLYVDVPALDMRSPLAMSLVSAMERGDMDEMSFAFKAIRQEWNEDYTERWITEVKLYDASVVTYPANPATVVTLHVEGDKKSAASVNAYPIDLALAEAEAVASPPRLVGD